MQLNLNKDYKQNILTNRNDRAIVLFLGLSLWVIIPILGVFPLLFFVHLNRKQNSKLNLIVTLIVILTITIFASSVDVISDLAVYINNYEKLSTNNPFEISGGQGVEFVLWVASYPIYIISNGSRYAFIFFWFFVFNALTFLVITKEFSARNYGLLSLFIISTPAFLDYQVFLVRQYLATLIFLIAVINIDKKKLMWGLYIISVLTHVANLLYLPILILYKRTKLLKSKLVKILMFTAGIILPFSSSLVFTLAFAISKYLPNKYASMLLIKTHFYSIEQEVGSGDFGIAYIEHFLIFIIIIIFLQNKKHEFPLEKFLYFLYPIFLFLMYVGRDIPMFSNRFAFILFPFAGLIYYFLIEYKWVMLKKEIIACLLLGKILYFCYFLNSVSLGNSPFTYLDKQIFNSSVFDYIEIVQDGFTNDIEIKDLPPNRFIQ